LGEQQLAHPSPVHEPLGLDAKFPMFTDQLKTIEVSPETKRHRLGHTLSEKNDDFIPYYTFYHKKTAAVPNGRMSFVDARPACLMVACRTKNSCVSYCC
jgi:hypothetical protein